MTYNWVKPKFGNIQQMGIAQNPSLRRKILTLKLRIPRSRGNLGYTKIVSPKCDTLFFFSKIFDSHELLSGKHDRSVVVEVKDEKTFTAHFDKY